MKKVLKIYGIFFRNNIKYLALSKANFVIGASVFLIMQIINIVAINYIFSDQAIQAKEAALVTYGIYLCAKGVDHFFTDNLWLFSMQMVRDGSYSQYIVLPMNSLFLILAEKVQFEAISELIIGLTLIINNSSFKSGEFLNVFLLYTIIILSGVVFLFAIKLICAALAFYFKTSISILDLVYNLSEFVKYPQYVYNLPIKNIFTYLFPLFIIFNVNIETYNLSLVFLINLVLLIIGFSLWNHGSKIYEDAGGR